MENDGANRTITEQTVDTPSIEVEDQTPITDLKNNYRLCTELDSYSFDIKNH